MFDKVLGKIESVPLGCSFYAVAKVAMCAVFVDPREIQPHFQTLVAGHDESVFYPISAVRMCIQEFPVI